jgi:TolA-binding protein
MATATTRSTTAQRPARAPKTKPADLNPAEIRAGEANGVAPAESGDQGDWVWLSQFTVDDWAHMICYLWRIEPITDRRRGGKETSIAKLGRSFDIDEIMKTYGSGMYRADICKIEPNGNQQKRIRQFYFTILNMDFPPRVPAGDWVDDPVNAQWKWAGPALAAQQANATAAGATPAAGPSVNDTFNTVLNGMRVIRGEMADNDTVTSQIVDLLRDQRDQMAALMNPATQFETLQRLLALVQPKESKGSTSENMFMEFMRDELRASRAEIRELRQSMQQQQPKSLLEQIKELKEATGLFRGTPGASGTDWGAVVTGVFDKIGDSLPTILYMLSQRPQQPGAAAAPGGWPAPPPRIPPAAPSAAAPPPPAAGPAPTAAPGAPPANMTPPVNPATGQPFTPEEIAKEQKAMSDIVAKHGQLIQDCVPFVTDQFRAGLTGYDLRDWFIQRQGVIKWAELRSDIAPDRLAALCEIHPVLRETMKPREKVIQFFTEFFTDQGEEPEGARVDDPEDEPPLN